MRRGLGKTESPVARELHQQWKFGRQVIGNPYDIRLFLIDDISVREERTVIKPRVRPTSIARPKKTGIL